MFIRTTAFKLSGKSCRYTRSDSFLCSSQRADPLLCSGWASEHSTVSSTPCPTSPGGLRQSPGGSGTYSIGFTGLEHTLQPKPLKLFVIFLLYSLARTGSTGGRPTMSCFAIYFKRELLIGKIMLQQFLH